MSMKTKGTRLYLIDPRNNQLSTIECPKSVTGLGLSKPQLDETCLDSDTITFGPGMATPGTASVVLDFDTAKDSHMLIDDLEENDVTAKWALGFSDGTAAPTVGSDGDFVLPTSRSWVIWEGYISDVPLDFALNANVAQTFQIQTTNRRRIIRKVLASS